MKTLKSTALVLGLFGLLAGTTTLVRAQDYQDNYQDDGYSTGNVSLQTFYDELSPYGTWIQDTQYGYVWRPDVDQSDFRPYYTNGRWAMTEYGNTWVSNYDWGWAPFHYGRWVINSYRQWIWLPDTNWGPAWVDWRSGDGYYGWAPMAPSISINLSFGRRYSVPEFCWNFIPQSNIYINSFPRYDYGRNNVYIRNTTIINNTYVYNRRSYYGGPRMEDIRRATNRDVRVYRFDQSSRPGASRVSGRDVSIYRPRPDRNVDNRSAAPRKFEQGNAGFNRNGRNANNGNRDSRTNDNNNNNNNRFGQGNNGRTPQTGSRTDGNVNRGDNNSATNRGDVFDRGNNGRADRGGQTNGDANQRSREGLGRGNDQRTQTDQNNQRNQTDRSAQMEQQRQQRSQQADQQRQQRDAQAQQQRAQQGQQQQQDRSAQMEQQRAQRSQQIQEAQQQQRAQRDAQAQQQRSQQADQQRAQMEQKRQQRDAQAQQQRSQAEQQQRQQRDAQAQQQRQQQQQQQQQRMERTRTESAPPQQQQQNRGGGERSSSEGGRPSRSGRG